LQNKITRAIFAPEDVSYCYDLTLKAPPGSREYGGLNEDTALIPEAHKDNLPGAMPTERDPSRRAPESLGGMGIAL